MPIETRGFEENKGGRIDIKIKKNKLTQTSISSPCNSLTNLYIYKKIATNSIDDMHLYILLFIVGMYEAINPLIK